MSHADFVHLHLHTEYSMLDGACRLDKLMDRARKLKFPALAITDHGAMHGVIGFYQAARKNGIRPIIGCEVYVAPGSRFERKSKGGGKDAYHHLGLLAKDETGYRNLIKLATAAQLEGHYYKPRIDKELLAEHKEGLIVLSGCLASEVPELIVREQLDRARATVDWFKQTLGPENFYLELQNHGIPEQAEVNRHLLVWAKEFGLKPIATNDVHYLEREHWKAHDCLVCIGTQTTLEDNKRLRYQPEQFYLRSAEEMKALFSEVPEAIQNTLEVAEKCNLEIEFGVQHYPDFVPPEHFTREGYLRHLLAEGLRKRYGIQARVEEEDFVVETVDDARRLPTFRAESDPAPGGAGEDGAEPPLELNGPAVSAAVEAVIERLRRELNTIEEMGYTGYFLIVGDFVRYGRARGVTCVARGSAAGSMVAYLLEISNVDPLRYELLFERFLNPERISPPDIDIDFADDRRAEVIEYVREKYGRDSVAQIVTFGTMGAKSVIRDVGRAMGQSYGACDRLAKMVPNDLKMTLEKALRQSAELKQAYDSEEATRDLLDLAFVLEDLSRNSSVHAAGVVIGDQPLVNMLPLKKDDEGTIVTQYPMGPVESLGLLKMDFLGLKTLTVIRNTCEMVKRGKGIEIPIDDLPLDDARTYDLLNKANTTGVFQLESSGMRDLCRKFQIDSIEHITALIALYRPGPMDLIPEFIRRRHGRMKIEYEHPLLEPICRETYGIMVYQEQVMKAAQALAGYTLGAADLLRRAMGKKKAQEMAKQREIFVEGCRKLNDIPEKKANRIFGLLEKFAGYGFNKSHAAAYAVVAYQTAYLKANHPVEFLCAIMTNDMGDTDKVALYIEEARAHDVEVLPPDVNESDVGFAPAREGKAIRFGLAAIKGVGEGAVQQIKRAREEGGAFESLNEFCERVDSRSVNRKALEALIKAGACDAFQETRATLWASLERALGRAAGLAKDRASGQTSLFGMFEEETSERMDEAHRRPEWLQSELLAAEKDLLGFYVTGHPLTPYIPIVEKYALCDSKGIGALPDRSMTRLGGLVAAVQRGVSKRTNKPYALATLEDLGGSVQVLCVNEIYEKYHELLEPNAALLVIGEVNNGDERPRIFPREIMPLDEAPRRFTSQVHLRLQTAHLDRSSLEKARDLARAHSGKCPLFLCLLLPGGEAVFIETNDRYRVAPSRELRKEVNDLFGDETYYVKVDKSLPERTVRRCAWGENGTNGNGS